MNKIVFNFIIYLLIGSGLIFAMGTFEVVRNQFMFDFVEENLLIDGTTPDNIYDQYLALKSNSIFDNTYFITFINFLGMLGLFYLIYSSWLAGWNTRPMTLSQTMINYSLLWILLFYVLIILFDYFKNLFVDQILVLLFNDLLNQIFIFNFFLQYFIGLFLISVLLKFFANQIRYFRTIEI